jgi:hypothetical protein
MATTFHQIQYWTWDIAPGNALWLSYGPDVRYKRGTVQVTACPSTLLPWTDPAAPAQFRTQTLYVPVVYITQIPTSETPGPFPAFGLDHCYAGFNIINGGQHAIRWFSVALTVIGA